MTRATSSSDSIWSSRPSAIHSLNRYCLLSSFYGNFWANRFVRDTHAGGANIGGGQTAHAASTDPFYVFGRL
jgi:hypothetical protein